jgi:hypothetical protein
MKLAPLILLAMATACLIGVAGCAERATRDGSPGSTPTTVPATMTRAGSPVPATTTAGPVISAEAYPPSEPYEIDPRFVRNVPEYRIDPVIFTDVFHDRYSMNYNSEGLLATVDEAPLVIEFSVTPGNRDPVYSFFILTVRDGDTGQVIGQEGYARTFSTDSPKRLVFTRPGKYHLNLYGTLVDVDLHVWMKR